jgi:tRNA/tmRNA/rRNA uracil-C5-methylase (TrmA/RlmC/RlmD family)
VNEGLQVGGRVLLTIHDIAFGGDGVGRYHEFVVFVPFVALGEDVEVEITELKQKFARGRLVQVIKASPDRVTAPCPYFGECGGCQYQHINYERQLELKHKQISDLFERIGKISRALILPVAPCPLPYGYRNRIMVRSQWDRRKQGLNIGFLRHDNPMVIDIEECIISEPAINQQLKDVRAHPPPRGGFKNVLRIVPEGWEVPPDSFFQNNFHLLPALLETVRGSLAASGAKVLMDAYCGVGFFSIELADLVEKYVGIELDTKAIKAARNNAQARRRMNGEFLAAATEDLLPRLVGKYLPGETCILLDPPRTGCRPDVLELLREFRPKQVIYVSCHPATLARDLNILGAAGVFDLKQVVPLDMFPQTQHVECVADLRGAQREG